MKVLSLNLHCFAEKNIVENQHTISNFILRNDIDIIFFQEVAQSEQDELVTEHIRMDNYALIVQQILEDSKKTYYLHYMFGNLAFGSYQEGLAILSKYKYVDTAHKFISKKVDYYDWHTRVIVNARIVYNNVDINLYSAHLGWSEGEEVFEEQIDRLITNHSELTIYAGDFNVYAGSKEYDYIINKGLIDCSYFGDKKYFQHPTHIKDLDVQSGENRIDYVFTNRPVKVIDRKIVFKDNLVSDHYGVYIEFEIEEV